MEERGSKRSRSASVRSSPSSPVTKQTLWRTGRLTGSRNTCSVAGERLAQKAVAQLPATTMSSMWTYASRWRMSARVYGAELELSSSSVVPVQRMSMEWAVAGTAMAALDFERRRLGFIARKVRFCHELHCKVIKTHPHVDRIDGTVSGRVGTDRDGTGQLGTGGCPANNVRGMSPRTCPRAGASLSDDGWSLPVL